MKVTLIQGRHGMPECHAAGCRDIGRHASDLNYTIDAVTAQSVALDFFSDFVDEWLSEGMSMDDVIDQAMNELRFMPCVSELPDHL